MSSPHKIIVVVCVWCDQRSENTWQSRSVAPNKFYGVCLRVCIWTKGKTSNINMQEQGKRRRFIRTGMFIDRKNVTSLKKGNSGKSVYPKLIKKTTRTYLPTLHGAKKSSLLSNLLSQLLFQLNCSLEEQTILQFLPLTVVSCQIVYLWRKDNKIFRLKYLLSIWLLVR